VTAQLPNFESRISGIHRFHNSHWLYPAMNFEPDQITESSLLYYFYNDLAKSLQKEAEELKPTLARHKALNKRIEQYEMALEKQSTGTISKEAFEKLYPKSKVDKLNLEATNALVLEHRAATLQRELAWIVRMVNLHNYTRATNLSPLERTLELND
jgi:hypothetical protein